jgi:hypothetical protein
MLANLGNAAKSMGSKESKIKYRISNVHRKGGVHMGFLHLFSMDGIYSNQNSLKASVSTESQP